MEITTKSKKGMELVIGVSGFQQEPKIELISPTQVQNRKIVGRVSIGIARGAAEEGFFCRGDVFLQGENAVKQVRDAIATLQKKVYRIYLGTEIINADGDLIEVPRWIHENGGVPNTNKSDITGMLKNAGIIDISVDDAEKMWIDKVAVERKPYIEAAQKIGKPVEYRRGVVECRDPREECSADIAIMYMHADGAVHTEYTHTY